MTSPIASQTKKRIQFSSVRLAIRTTHVTTDRIGTSGTKGTRKPRGRSGCVLRRINTAMDTSTKANNVPMFERSASVPISKIPAGIPTKIPATHVGIPAGIFDIGTLADRSEEHTSELQSRLHLVCRLLL